MEIMHVTFFFTSDQNCGCCGNEYSPNMVLTDGLFDNSKSIPGMSIKISLWIDRSKEMMHVTLFLSSDRNCVCYGNGKSQ